MRNRGFTLIELMVSVAVFSIFMVGMLNLLDTSTKVAQLETSLADTQENVRFAAYHIMRTARMMGGGGMPFAGITAGGNSWVSGELASNVGGAFAIEGYDTVSVLPGSDVLTLRGFFEISPFFVDKETVFSGTSVNVPEYNKAGVLVNDLSLFTPSALEGRGLLFMGTNKAYTVGEVGSGASLTGDGTDRKLVMTYQAGESLWPNLNKVGAAFPPTFDVHRVGVLESYTYFVSGDNTLMRVRISGNSSAEPVAINIGGLQIALGVDTDGDGQVDSWNNSPADASAVIGDTTTVVGMRITVLGRTSAVVPDWEEPLSTFQVEDGTASGLDRNAKWRRIEVAASLRNFRF